MGDTQSQSTDGNPAAVEGLHEEDEALPLLAEDVFRGDTGILEDELSPVRSAHTELFGPLVHREPGSVPIHDESRDPLHPLRTVRPGGHDEGPRVARVGDEDLGPVEHEMIAVPARRGLRSAGIRSRVRFGEPEGAQLITGCQIGNESFSLLLGGELEDGVGAERHVGGQGQRGGTADATEFDHRQVIGKIVHPGSAVFFRNADPEQAELLHLGHGFLAEFRFPIQLDGPRLDLVEGESTDHVLHHHLFFGKLDHGFLGTPTSAAPDSPGLKLNRPLKIRVEQRRTSLVPIRSSAPADQKIRRESVPGSFAEHGSGPIDFSTGG